MFGNKEKTNDSFVPVVTKPTSKDIKTLIGEGCKVEGNFFIPTFTRVDGIVKGDLHGDSGIIIGNAGKVEGNVFATEVVLYGEVKGKVEAQKLEMKKGSVLNGDIVVATLITENGCVFNGHCSMNSNEQQTYSDISENDKIN
jgi:cytoskeletal protein CcmA (bactofilin family)